MILGNAHTILNIHNCHPGKCALSRRSPEGVGGSIYPGSFVCVERKIPGQARDDKRKTGKTTSFFRWLCLLAMTVFFINTAHAACSNPPGVEGEQIYNSTHKVMQYCDGTHWTAMRATGKLNKAGDTMTGPLNLSGAPIASNEAATKEYVDTVMASASGGGTAICGQTRTSYTGSLGGISGADTICASEFGTGWRFASAANAASGLRSFVGMGHIWINYHFSNCSNWTSSNSSNMGTIISLSVGGTHPFYSISNQRCNTGYPLLCCNF